MARPALRIDVLGSLRVNVDGSVRPAPPRVADLLAMLTLRPGGQLSTDALIDGLWQGAPPRTAAKVLQGRIHELRRLLGDSDRVQRGISGYTLLVEPDELDATRFAALVAEADGAARHGRVDDQVELLRAADGLWRGPAYQDHTAIDLVHDEAMRLEEHRLEAVESRIDGDLAQGHHHLVVAELAVLSRRHPVRERFWKQLMLALYRCGRQADALQTYQDARRVLIEEFGLDPGPEMQELEQRILAQDPALAADVPAPPRETARPAPPAKPAANAPNELPRDIALTGRDAELEAIHTSLTSGGCPVVALNGPGGTGKSALAVHAAHRASDHFPDGRLYINLHATTPGVAVRQPLEVLQRLLQTLGAANPPQSEGEAAGMFRSLTHERRLLFVLEDAADLAQVIPLLPNGAGCAVIVTSRRPLAGPEVTTALRLGPLGETAAVELLGHMLGADRVGADGAAARHIVELCDRLPLAIRIVGARLLANPVQPLASFAARLTDERHRLDELEDADLAVRTSIATGYDYLRRHPRGGDAAALFAHLGLWFGTHVTASTAAVLPGWPTHRAERALGRLVEAQLLHCPSPDRYTLHDLVRLFAQEQAQDQLTGPERAEVVERTLHYQLDTVRNAVLTLSPGLASRLEFGPGSPSHPEPARPGRSFADRAEAVTWIRGERDNLLAAAQHAAELPPPACLVTVGLAAALMYTCEMHGWFTDLETLAEHARRIALRTEDERSLALALTCSGHAANGLGRARQAVVRLEQALETWRRIEDRSGEALTLTYLAYTYLTAGDVDRSMGYCRQSLTLYERLGDRLGHALALLFLSNQLQQHGMYDQALTANSTGTALVEGLDEPRMLGIARGIRAAVHARCGRYDEALRCFEEALELLTQSQDRYQQARCFWGMSQVRDAQGRAGEALAERHRALDILQELRLLGAEDALLVADRPEEITRLLPEFLATEPSHRQL
ncbi:AfsR/SARP family transcriptional regulator [Actinocorallia populi]|uniref:AfsR/SARP family transcriptional regulator n=1 Tax=Actinocorallia populi TaxID=2079200 RepID=UPI000D091213|nr:BTAD domain-containing putative transcriptional regulator [Actinocorallia populi]